MEQCLLCLDATPTPLCPPCIAELPWVEGTCYQCGRAHNSPTLCQPCQKQPPAWDNCTAPLLYEPPITAMIRGLKFDHKLFYARRLSELFVRALHANSLPELLLPVPLHPWRMIGRGFNQSGELSRALSRLLNIPYRTRHIKRIKHTPPQRELDKSSRKHNLKDAFALHKPIQAKHIAIVDDVLTTGETLDRICMMLREQSDVKRIDVWAMAQREFKVNL